MLAAIKICISIKPLAATEIGNSAKMHRLPTAFWQKTSFLEKQSRCPIVFGDENHWGWGKRKAQSVLQERSSYFWRICYPGTKTTSLRNEVPCNVSLGLACNKHPVSKFFIIGS